MNELTHLVVTVFIGIIAVTLVDSVGSILSRRLNFPYAKLTLISLAVYIAIGFTIGLESNIISTIGATYLVGIYDATIGYKLSVHLKANWGIPKEQMETLTSNVRMVTMFVVSLIFGAVGFYLSTLVR